MRISIFGMGYVGVVSAACLARDGNHVIGIDPNKTKVDLVNSGQTPIIEKDMTSMIREAVDSGRLRATTDVAVAMRETDISFVCVGTPSSPNGSLDLRHVRKVCEEIGNALADKTEFHTIVIRSTILPGTMRETVIPTLERSSAKQAGVDFGVCNNPEFLREGTAVSDYYTPPKTVIGELDPERTDAGDQLASIYEEIDAPLIRTAIDVAEMVKYVDNIWHALKVGFGNEIGRVCKARNIDSHTVMNIFSQDTKLNISAAYLRPGFAYGGSCLPKDLRALRYLARTADVDIPILNAIETSNQLQIDTACSMIAQTGTKKIGFLGLSFKAGTDDLRESPLVAVVEWLIGKGYDLRIFDRNVNLAQLVGANRDYILNHIPHISDLFVPTIEEAIAHAEAIVIGNESSEFSQTVDLAANKMIIDLVRLFQAKTSDERYQGISW